MGAFDLFARPVHLIDSHTEGEPTRVVLAEDWPLPGCSVAELRAWIAEHFDQGWATFCNEPRGYPAMVGALLRKPHDPACDGAVVFFNNAGVLNMCGHGTIGLIRTLEHLGRLRPGGWSLETSAGVVRGMLHADGAVTLSNVPSRRLQAKVEIVADGHRHTGDVAWGGNWFYICGDHGLDVDLANLPALQRRAELIYSALLAQGVRGDDGGEIDHIELTVPLDGVNGARGFVRCPGGEYDRSPCGTGTSAKLACLAADGALAPGDAWTQESVIGSAFTSSYRLEEGQIVPEITGRAFITGETRLHFDPRDPFRAGIHV